MTDSSSLPPGASFRREAGANLKLALPLMAAQIAAVGMGTVDTILAGQLGAQALAAVAVGSNYAVLFFIFFHGVLMACSPIVAQRTGAGRPAADTGVFLRELLPLGLAVAALWWLLLRVTAAPLIGRLGLPPETVRTAVEFLHALSWSAFGFSGWFVLRYTAEGLGQPRPILLAGVVGLVVNGLLAWGLLFGHWGLPALGAPGCGWATSIAALAMAATLALQYRLRPALRPVRLFEGTLIRPAADSAEVLRLGLPIGLILAAEAGLFVMAAMQMSLFGESTVAAYQVAINFAALMFMIPLGIGLAATVRVGQAVGAGLGAAEVRFRGRVGMQLGLINAASNALIMLLLASLIVRLYTADPEIGALAVKFLWLAAAFQFFDAVQVTANGALRGIKDTRLPMLITVVAYWAVGFPVSWWLAFHTPLGPDGVWWGLTVGLAVAAVGLAARFRHKAQSA